MARSNLKIYTNAVTNAKLGQSDVVLYLGETKVYPTTIPLTGATVTCDSATYTGSVQVAQSFTVTLNGTTLTKDVDYTVTQNNGGTNAGTYTVVVTGINDYYGTASGSFVINKATATLPGTISGDRKDVHNTPARATVSKDYVGGTLQYSTDNGSSWSDVTWSSGNLTANPSNSTIGDINVIFRVNPDNNHTVVTSSAITLTVIKATDASVTVTASSGLTYNGSTQTIATASNAHGVSAYYIGYKKGSQASADSEITWGSANTSPLQVTDAGDYYIYYKFTADSQHSGDKVYTYVGQVTIAKASRTISISGIPSSMTAGDTATVTYTISAGSGDGSVSISSSNTSVVTVNGSTLTCVGAGSTTITVSVAEGTNYLSASANTSTTVTDPYTGHAYVDLGLPSGTKWATMNVGANSETGYGNYYMYGKGARTYNNSDSAYSGTENPLASGADTARQVWGGEWHMPTQAQFNELVANTTNQLTTINNVSGIKFTASNGEYVFFPAAGYYYNRYGPTNVGNGGYYRSSTPYDSLDAYVLSFFGNNIKVQPGSIVVGETVRPVVG